MVTIDDVRAVVDGFPRSYEVLVRDRVKFRVGSIVYLAFSRDETLLGFAFPKEERDALIASAPEKFLMPKPSDQRFNWVVVRLCGDRRGRAPRARHRRVAHGRAEARRRRAPGRLTSPLDRRRGYASSSGGGSRSDDAASATASAAARS